MENRKKKKYEAHTNKHPDIGGANWGWITKGGVTIKYWGQDEELKTGNEAYAWVEKMNSLLEVKCTTK